MTKPINLIKLLVLVVFPQLSVAMLQKLSEWASKPSPYHYELNYFCVQSPSMENKKYQPARFSQTYYYDNLTKYDYKLIASTGENVFENKGRNTDIVFFFGNKIIIHAKDNVEVLYSIDFAIAHHATLFANNILSTTPTQYKKCEGSHSYRINSLSERTGTTPLVELGREPDNYWCIFKNVIHKADVTTFIIKWIGRIEAYGNPLCVFSSTDYRLTPLPDAGNKLELSIFLDGKLQYPKYVVETSTPVELEAFLK